MKRCININTQIVVSMQLSTDHLPKEFNYTCFFWLPNTGIFNDFSKLVACGTREGAIIIIGNKKENKIDNDTSDPSNSDFVLLSLLTGHQTAITDICISIKMNSFLSVSKDSKICGWSCLDYSCEFQLDLKLNYGNYFFSLYATRLKYIWLTRYGESIFLIDINKGKIIKQYSYPGIKSFEIVCTNPILKNSPAFAVCVGEMQTTFYLLENKIEFGKQKTIFNDGNFVPYKIVKASQYGIVKIVKNNFEIIEPSSEFTTLYKGTFNELPDDDFIKSVNFDKSQKIFAAGSFLGRFFIVNMKKGYDSISVQYVYPFSDSFSKTLFLNSDFAISDQQDIIFSSNSKSIFCINNQNQVEKVKFDEPKQGSDNYEDDIIYMNDTQGPFYLRSNGNVLYFISMKTQKPARSIEFPRKITAIFERKINHTNRSQFVIGFDNGTVCFYTDRFKFVTIPTSSIQCFISITKKPDLLTIGNDGSACLFYNEKEFITFDTPLIPIKRVYYIQYLDLYLFGYDDSSFLIYSSKSSIPIEIITRLPDQAKLIWPVSTESGYMNNFSSVMCCNIGNKSVPYEIIDIPSLSDSVRDDYFQYQRNLIIDYEKKMKMKYLIGLCNNLFNLMENQLTNINGSNLSIIGANRQPTFFYCPFYIHGEMFCDLSPFTGSSLFISYCLLSEATNQDGRLLNDTDFFYKIHFLPALLQFMYFPNDIVKRTVCKLCIQLSNYVSFQTCQEYFQTFTLLNNLCNVEEYDKFLMAILIVRYPNTLPSFFISELYDFLDELTVSNSEQAVLAISILIDGISLWGNKTEKKEQIFITIIESMLRQTRSIFLSNKFYNVACSDMDSLIKAFPELISSSLSDMETIEKILNFYTNISFKNQKACGGIISDLFASICLRFPRLINAVASELESHSQILPFVKINGHLFLIGLNDSLVNAYQEGKLLFSIKLFDEITDIDFVDIGPKDLFGVAVSAKLKKGKIFYLCKSTKRLFRSPMSRVLEEFNINDIQNINFFHANWANEQMCKINVTHSK